MSEKPSEGSDEAIAGESAEANAATAATQVEELTPNAEMVESAARSLTHLFKVMDIRRVISVDDSYEGTVEDLLAMAEVASRAGTVEFAGRFDLSVPPEAWRVEMQDVWEAAEIQDRRVLLAAAHKESGDRELDEAQLDVSHLEPLVAPTGAEFEAVSPADWPRMLTSVVLEAQDRPTLVLFDQEMGERGDEGIRFAEKAFKEDVGAGLYIALLTRMVDKGEENARWLEITHNNPKLKKDRFVVISKEHLGPDPKTFPEAIKIVLMAKPATALRNAVAAAVENAREAAAKKLDELSPEDFQKIVVMGSLREGVWEAESLLRVFQLAMVDHTRRELYSIDLVKESAAQIRQLWINDQVERSSSETARALAHAENYDDPIFVNEVHLPIELGDMFEANGRQFVVVEQPCDLMVRTSGERTPDLHDVTLLEIQDARPSPMTDGFELPFFRQDGGSSWVHLKRSISVPVRALDYTVFNTEGQSVLVLSGECPVGVWPAWEARFKKLVGKGDTIKKQVEALSALQGRGRGMSADLHRALVQRILHTDSASGRKVSGSVEGDKLSYGISRTGRIRAALARDLLLQYSLHRARAASDFPLAASPNL